MVFLRLINTPILSGTALFVKSRFGGRERSCGVQTARLLAYSPGERIVLVKTREVT
jgi:hypothetical protein